MRKYKISVTTLLIALILALSAFAFTAFAPKNAFADENDYRTVTIDGSNVFYTAVNGAQVTYYTQAASGDAEEEKYVMFHVGDEETVTYRKNLAYCWRTAVDTDVKFSMTFGFVDAINFDRYVIKFQSQQYAKNGDDVSENCLIFTPTQNGVKLTVAEDSESDVQGEGLEFALNEKIEITFADYDAGNYKVKANGNTAGTFYNMTKACAKYVSSGSNAVTPLTFTADMGEEADENAAAHMVMYELNGQSFKVHSTVEGKNGKLDSGVIYDDTAPVLCMNQTLTHLEFGGSFDIDYTVIDVIASSPKAVINYYVLSTEQYLSNELDYDQTEYPEPDPENTTPDDPKSPFREVTTSSKVKLIRDNGTFVLPENLTGGETAAELTESEGGYITHGLVKAYAALTDVTGSRGQSVNTFLDWYVPQEYRVNIYSENLKNDLTKYSGFIRIAEDKQGATYSGYATGVAEDATYEQRIAAIEEDYQAKIDQAIKDLKYDSEKDDEKGLTDGKLYAGSDRYFYLPDFSAYATDNLGSYTDLKYNIYYWASSKGSETSLSSSDLAIKITESDTIYRFTIFVTDADGNPMRYPVYENGVLKTDADGKPVYETIASGEVWDEKNADKLPFFEFRASYKPATVEEPQEQKIAYVDKTYNNASFEIKGVSGSYDTEYKMYTFDRDAMYEDKKIRLTYSEFIKNIEKLFKGEFTYDFGDGKGEVKVEGTRAYFTQIIAESDLHEGDENYDEMSAYKWNKTNVTFVPQSTSEYYVISLKLTDNRVNTVTEKFMAVRASVKANSFAGEDDWVENNITSIILLSVGGVCFIALVVLLIVKPKEKTDVDELDEAKPAKAKKSKKVKE